MTEAFFGRLSLLLLSALIAAVGIPALFLALTMGRDFGAIERENLAKSASQAEWFLENSGLSPDLPGFSDSLQALSERLDVSIVLLRRDGTPVAVSGPQVDSISVEEGLLYRHEILEARKEGFGSTVRKEEQSGEEMLYAALYDPAVPWLRGGYIRVSRPAERQSAGLESRLRQSLILLVGCLIGFFALAFFLGRRMTRAMNAMVHTAEAIGRGDHAMRIRFAPGREFEPLARSINEMAEGIERQITVVSEQKGQLEAVLNGIREGVAVLDEQGVVKSCNRHFQRIFPRLAELTGLRPLEIDRNPALQSACSEVLEARREGAPEPRNLQLKTEGERYFDVSVVPLSVQGVDAAAVLVFHEITEHMQLEKIRRDFVANVSHELRTPLTSIKGYAETMRLDPELDRETREMFLDVILRNANSMSDLVHNLLELARIESGRGQGEVDDTSLAEAAARAWEECAAAASDRQVELENELLRSGITVRYNEPQLVMVLRNLFENAIKYSPSKGRVRVFALRTEKDVCVGVQDEGPGIPEADQPRIFERFYRVEKHAGTTATGTGLGLAICRHIVQNHGGRIWVESPPAGSEKGSLFLFSIPF